jgi:hypothetical protein
MSDKDISAVALLLGAILYAVFAAKQTTGFLLHRKITLCCMLLAAFGFWAKGDSEAFKFFVLGFVVGWAYQFLRIRVKAESLFGQSLADTLFKDGN